MKRMHPASRSTLAVLVAVLASLGSAFATSASAQDSKQNKIAECNHASAGKTGADRQAFMSSCLSKPTSPQARMKVCNQRAVGKKGDERRDFMSSCLRKDG